MTARGRESSLAGPAKAALLVFSLTGCASPLPRPRRPVEAKPLHLDPLADLTPAGGLEWVVDVKPRALLADPALIPVFAEVLPEATLDRLRDTYGGLDLRATEGWVVASYTGTLLLLAHQVLEPARLEATFAGRVADVEGRAIDHPSDDPRATIVRTWGSRGKEHATLVVFGVETAGLAIGADAPLRAAEAFAQGKLKRAEPAWASAPLARVAQVLGDVPVRAAVPGPFTGVWADGLGGLLGTATALGVGLEPLGERLRLRLVLTGLWGDRGSEASQRLESRYEALTTSEWGGLLGLRDPGSFPNFARTADTVTVEVSLPASHFVRGVADALSPDLAALVRAHGNKR